MVTVSDKEPLVSVIIPAYNEGALLALAIESALGQSYPCVEVIVVNDGSTDPRAREVAERFAGRIRYIERENGGVAAARNTGIEASRGELIALLDQDDVWLPHKLATQVEAHRARPHVALIHSRYYLIDSAGKRAAQEGSRAEVAWMLGSEYGPLPRLLMDVPICASTTLIPRRILAEVGLFDTSLSGTDDWDLWLRLAARGYRFYCVDDALVEYRTHTRNASHNIERMVSSTLRTLDKFYAMPGVPEEARGWRRRAYGHRHAWAAANLYATGDAHAAAHHLREAARIHPESVTSLRFLRSMVSGQWSVVSGQLAGDGRGGSGEVGRALRFVLRSLAGILPPATSRRLNGRAQVVRAMYDGGAGLPGRAGAILRAVGRNPRILLDEELWVVPIRALARRTGWLRRSLGYLKSNRRTAKHICR